jgi:hypothetical protein
MNEKPKTSALQTTNLTPVNNNDAAVLTNLARELQPNDIIGLPLKYAKGFWFIRESKDKEIKVEAADTFAVDPLSYAEGWFKWWDKHPILKIYARRVDGFVAPQRGMLPDNDNSKWPIGAKGPEDPWQPVQLLLLKQLTGKFSNELLTWQSNTWGGSTGAGEFLNSWAEDYQKHPGHSPVVRLESWDKPNAAWGKIPTPRLKIVSWTPFGEGQTPPGDPARATLARQVLAALPKPDPDAATKPGRGMDDEIAF